MKSIYSVGQINTYIRNMFAQDYLLHQVAVRGEVSNCKYHSSGHIYFTLKDTSGTLSCVMFAGRRRGLSFTMREGDQVIVTGAVDVYERDGRYQLYADRIIRDGVGLLNERYEALKRSLEERGMFDEQYKQPIPRFIRTLGVVTAPTGAAVRDIINIASRRNPYVEIILYPAQVQGDGAAESIVRGIRALEQIGVDTMIIGRGGGSIEDLWAFNEEIVAQAVFDCTVPIISAVGHETDTVISDYVADRRAPTPSAAAELAVYEMRQLDEQLAAGLASLRQAMASRITQERMRTASMERALQSLSPSSRVRERRMRAMQLQELYELRMREKLSLLRHRLERTAGLLEAQSPVARMAAGYGYLTDGDGKQIRSVLQVQAGDRIGIRIRDGKIRAQVTDTGVDRL
ncbi:MAG: exodeoxyribonuclease VII large subunit [Lachnospiraceae bacterium]|nr:exodeoxyribonuclease VII large subunit [Lachnospiraceae bacterium]